jgi:hypothetical protein
MQKLRNHGENTDNSDIVNAPEPFFLDIYACYLLPVY